MTLQEIASIIEKGEGIKAEFKESKNKLPRNLFETICAFLNTKGGTILLGVSDNGIITGIENDKAEQLKKDIANSSNNPQKLFPVFFLQIQDYKIDQKRIISIEVPESSQVHKTNGKIFIRNQDGDYLVEHPVEIAKIVNRKQSYHTEQRIYPRIEFQNFNSELIRRVKNLIKINNPDNHWWELNDKEFLTKAGFYKKDETGNAGFTLAAVLFFGTDELIQTILPAYKFEALLRKNNIDRYDDRLTVRTNIIDAYDLLMSFISKHLNDPFYLEDEQRISLRSKIFRELVANIIAHREYLSPAPAIITILKNKIEFKNPNNPEFFGKINPEIFSPVAKNPTISKLMLLMGRVEEVGSGIYNVKKYLPYYDKTATFEFIDDMTFTTTIRFGDITSQNTIKTDNIESPELQKEIENISERIRKEFGKNSEKILLLIYENPYIKTVELASLMDKSTRTVEKYIANLKKAGVIKRKGPKLGGYWKITNLPSNNP